MKKKHKSLFRTRTFQLLLVLFVSIAIPLTVFLAQQTQIMKNQAQEGAALYFVANKTYALPSDTVSYTVYIHSGSIDLSEVTLEATYRMEKLHFDRFVTDKSPFDVQTEYFVQNGLLRIGREALVPVSGNSYMGTIKFIAKEPLQADAVTPLRQSIALASTTQKNVLTTASVISQEQYAALIKQKPSFFTQLVTSFSAFLTTINPFRG